MSVISAPLLTKVQLVWDIQFNLMAVFAFLVACLLHLKLKYRILSKTLIVIGQNSNDKVKAHSLCSVHTESVLAMKSFEEVHSGMQPSINTSLSTHQQKLYDINCKRLDAIIDCIILCGRQNIALRGHMDADSSKSINKGNFKAILEFRAIGDPMLQEHLKEGVKNAQYTTAEIQNEIISIADQLFLKRYVKK